MLSISPVDMCSVVLLWCALVQTTRLKTVSCSRRFLRCATSPDGETEEIDAIADLWKQRTQPSGNRDERTTCRSGSISVSPLAQSAAIEVSVTV